MRTILMTVIVALLCAFLPSMLDAQPPVRVWEGAEAMAQPADQAGDAGPAAAPADPAPDPTTDPGGFFAATKDAFAASKFFGVIVLLWGVARVLASEKARAMASFLEGKMARAAVTGLIGVAGAAALSMAATGAIDWQAVIGAIMGTVAAFMSPPHPKPSTMPSAKA